MSLPSRGALVRIHIVESDQWQGRPLYDAIVQLLRERGVAGATVIRGLEGFGASHHLRTTRILRLSEDLPIVVEVVDDEERLRALLPELDAMVTSGLITLEKVEIVTHRTGGADPSA